jgi:anion-transporting  ArsA/GET3 family ATPase
LAGQVAGLTLSSDPAAETAAYRAEVLTAQGGALDAAGRALLEEDLRSPCTEEIAVFCAFAREVTRGTDRFVVLDTAPTGHTLLLLDASEAYNRELQRQPRSTQPESVLRLLELSADELPPSPESLVGGGPRGVQHRTLPWRCALPCLPGVQVRSSTQLDLRRTVESRG